MYVWSKGRAPTIKEACALAKKDVDINKPAGSRQKGHCRCLYDEAVYERRFLVDICR